MTFKDKCNEAAEALLQIKAEQMAKTGEDIDIDELFEAFVSGAEWAREESAKFWLKECDHLRAMCEKMAAAMSFYFKEGTVGFGRIERALAEWEAMKGEWI